MRQEKKCKWKCRLLQIVVTLLKDFKSIEAYSVDPEQTAPFGAVCLGSTLYAIEAF